MFLLPAEWFPFDFQNAAILFQIVEKKNLVRVLKQFQPFFMVFAQTIMILKSYGRKFKIEIV